MSRLLLTLVGLLIAFPLWAADRPPNIVFIISDDHGWMDYGFMGHKHIRTPHIDRLAGLSLTLPRGYVPSSLCCPSLATILTGLYPHQHKITGNDPPRPANLPAGKFYASEAFTKGRERLNQYLEAVPTLPRLLASKGYLSLQTGKWWQGDYRRGGFTHGMTKGQRHGDEGLAIGRQTMQPIRDFLDLAGKQDKPFFLWYAPMMPHTPHNPPERLLQRYRKLTDSLPVARYWAMVEWFDETVGELLQILDDRKLTDNTLVVYVTDNGWLQDPTGPGFVRSKRSPYDAGLRTPILLRWPGKIQPQKSDELASSIDLVPTVLSAVGLKRTPAMQGIDLRDAAARSARKSVFGACFAHDIPNLDEPTAGLEWRWTIREQWKLIVPRSGKAVELYNLQADPQEKTNLAEREPARVKELLSQLDGWWLPKKS